MRIYLFFLLLLSLVTLSCSKVSKLPESFSPINKLVFIEDIDDKGGLYDGNFGDIVIFDPVTKQKYILTDDEYYNYNTKWAFSGQSIVFDSNRGYGYDPFAGLSNPCHLFRLDIKTRNLIQLDLPVYKKKKKDEEVDDICPVIDSSNTLMVFASYNEVPGKMDLILYSLTENSFDTLMNNIEALDDIHWDGEYIAFTYCPYDKGVHKELAIRILNWKTGEIVSTIFNDNWVYDIGDLKHGVLLYSGNEMVDNFKVSMFAYFIDEKLNSKILTLDSLWIEEPVFARNKTIYFSGGNFTNIETREGFNDIYSYNLITKKVRRLTHDKHDKECLDYYDYPDSLNYLKDLEALIR